MANYIDQTKHEWDEATEKALAPKLEEGMFSLKEFQDVFQKMKAFTESEEYKESLEKAYEAGLDLLWARQGFKAYSLEEKETGNTIEGWHNPSTREIVVRKVTIKVYDSDRPMLAARKRTDEAFTAIEKQEQLISDYEIFS